MKLFKKLFSVLVLCIGCVILAASAGCNTLSEGDGWTEVQSITYTTENGTTTLTSKCFYDIKVDAINQSEYDNAPNEEKNENQFIYCCWCDNSLGTVIDSDRKNFTTKINSFVGKTYYKFYEKETEYPYDRLTLNNYTIKYVKVKAISDKVIEIDYDNEIKQISTLSYEITYFTN